MTEEQRTLHAFSKTLLFGGLALLVAVLAMWGKLAFLAPHVLMIIGLGFLTASPTGARAMRIYKALGIVLFSASVALLLVRIFGD